MRLRHQANIQMGAATQARLGQARVRGSNQVGTTMIFAPVFPGETQGS